jgi:hypothetical protein
MLRSLPGRNYAARVLTAISCDNKKHAAARHADNDVAIFPLVESVVRFFDAIGVLQSRNRVLKIHPVQPQVRGSLGLVPLAAHPAWYRLPVPLSSFYREFAPPFDTPRSRAAAQGSAVYGKRFRQTLFGSSLLAQRRAAL